MKWQYMPAFAQLFGIKPWEWDDERFTYDHFMVLKAHADRVFNKG